MESQYSKSEKQTKCQEVLWKEQNVKQQSHAAFWHCTDLWYVKILNGEGKDKAEQKEFEENG